MCVSGGGVSAQRCGPQRYLQAKPNWPSGNTFISGQAAAEGLISASQALQKQPKEFGGRCQQSSVSTTEVPEYRTEFISPGTHQKHLDA